jgi:hypothetical protein
VPTKPTADQPEPSARAALQLDEVLTLEDDLQGPDGERPDIVKISVDRKVLTLYCHLTDSVVEWPASDVLHGIRRGALPAIRYQELEIPPEWE